MQRWLRRYTPDRRTLEQHWFLRPFTAIMQRAQCWSFHRASVTRAFAFGLFVAFIPPAPPLPIHLTLCLLFSMLLRLNLPVMFATTFASNPLTWFPQVLASVWVGAKLMGLDFMPFMRQIEHQRVGDALHHLWSPLLLGSLVLGCVAGALGYLLAKFLWRAHVLYQLRRRRARARRVPGCAR
jgi:uncharacterized protein (DUF2062 family)